MAYTMDLADAARRHLEAANCLHDCAPPCRRPDIAGYLYGIAAECALKIERDDGPFWQHFPVLKSMVRESAQWRHTGVLRRFAEDDDFMNEWSIEMRYAPKQDIEHRLVARWRQHATEVIAAMEEC